MKRSSARKNDVRPKKREKAQLGSIEWVRTLPDNLLESHPRVQELRHTLEVRDVALAAKEREIARLRAALAFGLKESPLKAGHFT